MCEIEVTAGTSIGVLVGSTCLHLAPDSSGVCGVQRVPLESLIPGGAVVEWRPQPNKLMGKAKPRSLLLLVALWSLDCGS